MSRLVKSFRRAAVATRAAARRSLRAFHRQDDGVAAVEFALIVPIMAMMTIGAIEMSEAVTVDRRVSSVADRSGDLVAQFNGVLETSEVGTRASVGAWMMGGYELASGGSSLLKITMTFIQAEQPEDCKTTSCKTGDSVPNNDARIKSKWVCIVEPNALGQGSAACTCPDTQYPGLPSGSSLLQFGSSPALLITNVEYKYKPKFFDFFLSGQGRNTGATYTLKDTVYHKPRGSSLRLNVPAAPSTPCGFG